MGIARGTWNQRGWGRVGAPALARTRRSLLQRPDATSRPESCRGLKKFPAILAASLRGRRISDEKGLIPPGGSLWTFLGIAPTASRRHRRRFTALPEKVWSLLAFCRDLGEEEKHHPSTPGRDGLPEARLSRARTGTRAALRFCWAPERALARPASRCAAAPRSQAKWKPRLAPK